MSLKSHKHKVFPFGKKMLRDGDCAVCREIAQLSKTHRNEVNSALNGDKIEGQQTIFDQEET